MVLLRYLHKHPIELEDEIHAPQNSTSPALSVVGMKLSPVTRRKFEFGLARSQKTK